MILIRYTFNFRNEEQNFKKKFINTIFGKIYKQGLVPIFDKFKKKFKKLKF